MTDALVDPSPEELRRAVESQICPWCQRGPFQVLTKHTWRAHQISADEFRKMGDFTATQSLCSPEHAAESRDRLAARPDRDLMLSRATEAAKTSGALDLARQVQKARRERDPARQEIVDLYQQGELLGAIAEQVRKHRSTVASVLHERGLTYDSTTRRFQNSSYRERHGAVIRDAQQTRQEAQRRRAETRIAEFRALGGDSAAVDVVAERWGLRRKIVFTFLRRHGVRLAS